MNSPVIKCVQSVVKKISRLFFVEKEEKNIVQFIIFSWSIYKHWDWFLIEKEKMFSLETINTQKLCESTCYDTCLYKRLNGCIYESLRIIKKSCLKS